MTSRRHFLAGCSVLGAAVALQPAGLLAAAKLPAALPVEMPGFSAFAREVGTSFRLMQAGAAPVTFRLVAAEKPRHAAVAQPERQFSLLFCASQQLGQNTYSLAHTRLGRLDVFIVPVKLPQDGVQYYEAVFNQAPQEGAVV